MKTTFEEYTTNQFIGRPVPVVVVSDLVSHNLGSCALTTCQDTDRMKKLKTSAWIDLG